MMTTKWQKMAAVISVAGLAWPAATVFAQDAAAPSPAPAAAYSPAAPQLTYGLQQVLQLAQARVGDETILAFVKSSGNSYALTADQIIYLRQQGISSAVITTMLSQSRPMAPAVAPAPMQAPVAASSYAAAPVAVAAPVTAAPAVTYVQTASAASYYYYPSYSSSPNYYYPDYYYPDYYGYSPVSFSFGWGGYYGGGWGGWRGGYGGRGGYYGGGGHGGGYGGGGHGGGFGGGSHGGGGHGGGGHR